MLITHQEVHHPLYAAINDPNLPEDVAARIAGHYDYAYRLKEGEAWAIYQRARLKPLSHSEFDSHCERGSSELCNSKVPYGFQVDKNANISDVLGLREQPRDEMRLARHVLATHRHESIYNTLICHEGQWYEYTDNWQPITESDLRAIVYEYVKRSLSLSAAGKMDAEKRVVPTVPSSLITSVMLAIRSLVTTKHEGWQLQNRADGIAFSNCLLIEGCWEQPMNPDYFSTNCIPYALNRMDDEPTHLLRMLQTSGMEEREIDVLQEYLGYCLTRSTEYQKALMIVGPSGSGKSLIASTVLPALVGTHNYCSKELNKFGNQFALADLPNKLVCACPDERSELQRGNAQGISRLLKIAGGDSMEVEKKGQDSFTESLHCKFVICGNFVPELKDASDALLGRLLILKTRKGYRGNGEDTELPEKIMGEFDAIVSWALRGLTRLLENGCFTDLGNEAIQEYREINNPVGVFLDQCTKPGKYTIKDDLYRVYEDCTNEPMAKNEFFKVLKQSGFADRRVTVDGNRVRVIPGIEVKNAQVSESM